MNRGGCKLAQFKEHLVHQVGVKVAQTKVMKTRKEFVEIFLGKGMTKQWGEAEFDRRWASNGNPWKVDLDPDCRLPRVQLYADKTEEEFDSKSKSQEIEMTTKATTGLTAKKWTNLWAILGRRWQQLV